MAELSPLRRRMIEGSVRAILRAASDRGSSGPCAAHSDISTARQSNPSGRNDVRAVTTVAAKRRGSLGGARDRHQP